MRTSTEIILSGVFWLLASCGNQIQMHGLVHGESADSSNQNVDGYSWSYSSWTSGACTDSSHRAQTRIAACMDSTGAPVDDSFCADIASDSLGQIVDDASCAPAASYGWTYSAWANTTCANTTQRTQTRSGSCVNSTTGATVADSFCNGTVEDVLSQLVTDASCASAATYDWTYSAWSNTTCANTTQRTQTRTGSCVNQTTGATMANSFCSGTTEGALSQLVTDATCAPAITYGWTYSAWANTTCANTTQRTQTRTGSCLNQTTGATVANSLCAGITEGVLSQLITDASCAPATTYDWTYSTWANTTCPNTTQRTQTRTGRCVNQTTGATVANSFCSGTTEGALSQLVNDTSCAPATTYAWSYSAWTSTTCANTTQRTQTRTGSCVNQQTGAAVANSFCAGVTEGVLSQLITDTSCAPAATYAWSYSAWTNTTCANSLERNQTRTGSCVNQTTGATVANSFCSSTTEGALSQLITDASCAPAATYGWTYGAWTNATCANTTQRTQTRTGSCVDQTTGATVANSFCSGIAESILSQLVTDASCTSITYAWNYGAWTDEECTDSSHRAQSRSATCINQASLITVADAFCSGLAESPLDQVISDSTCGVGDRYVWEYSDWETGACLSSTQRSQARASGCLDHEDFSLVSDSFCSATAQGALLQGFSDAACNPQYPAALKVTPGDSQALLVQNDLNVLKNFSATAALATQWFTQVFGAATGSAALNFFNLRIHYLLSTATQFTITPVEIAASNDPRTTGVGGEQAANLSGAIWENSLAIGKEAAITIDGTKVPIVSGRTGVMFVDPTAYSATGTYSDSTHYAMPASMRIEVLLHEARHSDCTGGAKGPFAGLDPGVTFPMACGHSHAICPPGHPFAGIGACDSLPWGAYAVSLIFTQAAIRAATPGGLEWQLLNQVQADLLTRFTFTAPNTVSTMLSGAMGQPDMSDQGATP